jgi:hypothetical protein
MVIAVQTNCGPQPQLGTGSLCLEVMWRQR